MENLADTPHLSLNSVRGNRYLPLEGKNYWTVGRSKDNDLVISDHCISRNHAILQLTETGEFYLIDLGSRNGTFVNGRRVGIPVTLRDADRITFGKTGVVFHCPPASQETTLSKLAKERDTLTSVLLERRLMSVMVADMRNFTTLTRHLEDQLVSSMIGSWFREAGDIIRQAGSWVDKYIGDAVMAIWFHGEEEVSPDDILKIFQALIDLNAMTQELGCQYPLPFPLRIGAGVNTGYAMVGNTGSGDHPDYTAIGDTVNAAFRFESATKEIGLDLAVGEKTYGCLANLEGIEPLFHQHTVSLKGYETPTLTYGTTFEELERFLGGRPIFRGELG